jgi:hypothetical protein
VRYRFKGIVRTTGQTVEGHAHGDTPDEALAALSEHGIVTESLREDPEPLNLTNQQTPFGSRIDSALDTAASQVPFDKLADKFKGKNVWVLDRDKIRRGVAQVVDQALNEALVAHGGGGGGAGSLDAGEIRKQVSDAISGLFKDNKNLTSEVSQGSSMKLDHAVDRIEQMVRRAESVLAQMTVAIGKMGSGGGGGWGGPRRFSGKGGGGGEQNAVLMEIFKENLRLRGIEIDEGASSGGGTATATATAAPPAPAETKSARPASPLEAGGGDNNH